MVDRHQKTSIIAISFREFDRLACWAGNDGSIAWPVVQGWPGLRDGAGPILLNESKPA